MSGIMKGNVIGTYPHRSQKAQVDNYMNVANLPEHIEPL